jgi:hypothetical protein
VAAVQSVLLSDLDMEGEGPAGLDFDLKNAFNEISRGTTATRTYAHRSLEPFWRMVHWSLSCPSALLVSRRGHVVTSLVSQRGVRQGDALGTFLFCVSMHRELQQAVASVPAGRVAGVALCDNFTLVGRASDVVVAGRRYRQLIEERGDVRFSEGQGKVMWLRHTDVPPCVRAYAEEHRQAVTSGDAVVKVLGVQLGACAEAVSAAEVKAIEADLQKADILFSPHLSVQTACTFTRMCIAPAATHLMRSSLPRRSGAAIQRVDAFVERMLSEKVLGFTAAQWEQLSEGFRSAVMGQARLPARQGYPGLGLGVPSLHQQGAFYASVAQAAPTLARPAIRPWAVANRKLEEALATAADSRHVREPTDDIRAMLPAAAQRGSLREVIDFYARDRKKARAKLQRQLSKEVQKNALATLELQLADRPAARAMLRAASFRGAARWALSLPDDELTVLSDDQYRTQARLHLGIVPGLVEEGIVPEEADEPCPFCVRGDALRRVAPLHVVSCTHTRRSMKLFTHNSVVHVVATFMQRAGLQASIKAVGFDPAGSRQAPDLVVHTDEGIKLIDVTIHNPLAALRMGADGRGADLGGCRSSVATLRAAEREKLYKYRGLETDHIKIVPFALTFHGGVGDVAKKVLSLGWVKRKLAGGDKRKLADQFRRAVSCAIVRGNADAFARFNEPVRARLRAREAVHVVERIDLWLAERRVAEEAAAAGAAPGAELGAGAGAEDAPAEDVISDASSASGDRY